MQTRRGSVAEGAPASTLSLALRLQRRRFKLSMEIIINVMRAAISGPANWRCFSNIFLLIKSRYLARHEIMNRSANYTVCKICWKEQTLVEIHFFYYLSLRRLSQLSWSLSMSFCLTYNNHLARKSSTANVKPQNGGGNKMAGKLHLFIKLVAVILPQRKCNQLTQTAWCLLNTIFLFGSVFVAFPRTLLGIIRPDKTCGKEIFE